MLGLFIQFNMFSLMILFIRKRIFSHLSETLNGSSTIKAYNAQERFIRKLEIKIDDNSSFLYSVNFSERFFKSLIFFARQIVFKIIIIFKDGSQSN